MGVPSPSSLRTIDPPLFSFKPSVQFVRILFELIQRLCLKLLRRPRVISITACYRSIVLKPFHNLRRHRPSAVEMAANTSPAGKSHGSGRSVLGADEIDNSPLSWEVRAMAKVLLHKEVKPQSVEQKLTLPLIQQVALFAGARPFHRLPLAGPPSAVCFPPLAASRAPPVARRWPSAVRRPPFPLRDRPSAARRPPSAVRRRPSAVRRRHLYVCRPPFAVRGLPSVARRFPSAVRRSPSAVRRRLSTVCRPPFAVRRRPSAVRRPPSAVRRPPLARRPPAARRPPSASCLKAGWKGG